VRGRRLERPPSWRGARAVPRVRKASGKRHGEMPWTLGRCGRPGCGAGPVGGVVSGSGLDYGLVGSVLRGMVTGRNSLVVLNFTWRMFPHSLLRGSTWNRTPYAGAGHLLPPRSPVTDARGRLVMPARGHHGGRSASRLSTEGRTKSQMLHVVRRSGPGRKLVPLGSPLPELRCRPATPRWLTAAAATNVRRTELAAIPRRSHRSGSVHGLQRRP
jgi:hypothetical protein